MKIVTNNVNNAMIHAKPVKQVKIIAEDVKEVTKEH
jgi:hypothetical protein